VDPDTFLSGIITGDEMLIHHWVPKRKQEPMEWKHCGSPISRKFWTCLSAEKILAMVFWDLEVVLHVDYMPHRTTIAGYSYAAMLWNL